MQKQEFTITVYTENQIGLLNRIAIIFSRRKININSLNVSPSEILKAIQDTGSDKLNAIVRFLKKEWTPVF